MAITRSNAATELADIYGGVLQASGLSADNYQLNYVHGDFTIVPANQLLIRVQDVNNSYGSNTAYQLASAQYWNPSANAGMGGVVDLASAANGNNAFTVNDGVGGVATFSLAPQAGSYSTSGALSVGNYQLATLGLVTENSANFSDQLTIVGAHQVNSKSLTASASGGVQKVYDGTTQMTGVQLGLSGGLVGDVLSVNGLGAFSTRNAGSNLQYTLNNLILLGDDAANYHLLSGTSFSGNDGEILRRTVTLNPQAVSQTYNGSRSYSPSAADLSNLNILLGVQGDRVSSASLSFDSKNVGARTLSLTAVTLDDGNNGNNYNLVLGSNTSSAITRLDSVTWIGSAQGGNWFDPANWAGGAVPDLSNVANVVIPNGVTPVFGLPVVFPAESGSVAINSLTGGHLQMDDGNLNIAGQTNLQNFTQNGGQFNTGGNFNFDNSVINGGTLEIGGSAVGGSFAQTGGSVEVAFDFTTTNGFSQGSNGSMHIAGNTQISDVAGGIVIGNLTTQGTTQITSTGGEISQAQGSTLVALGETTLQASHAGLPANIVLDGINNNFQANVNATGQDITLRDVNGLIVSLNASGDSTLNTGGNLLVSGNTHHLTTTTNNAGTTQFGSTTVAGDLNSNSAGAISQTGALSVLGTTQLNAAIGNINLNHPNNNFVGPFNAQAHDISVVDGGSLVLGNITAGGAFSANAIGNISQRTTAVLQIAGRAQMESSTGTVDLNTGVNQMGGGVTIIDNNSRAAAQAAQRKAENKAVERVIPPLILVVPTPLNPEANNPPPLTWVTAALDDVSMSSMALAQSSSANTAPTAEANSAGISIELQQAPSQTTQGMVSVLIPKGTATSGAGFSFALPARILQNSNSNAVINVTLANGAPLPNWLRFEQQTRLFVAEAVPDGAFPIQLVINIDGQQTVLVISERNE